ncbi:MAG: Rpn family recombination-promoting nuclease/putative transposase [Clostridia bacterium]|nr:Rpn family recombination-promoting nuclease/putative transposase [Clostridia bacterium]
MGILDIKAKLNDNTVCDIEMQIADRRDIEKRILLYWSKLYSQGINSGDNYCNLQKTIIVLFSDYNLYSLKNIEKCVSKWQITESDYVKTILTDVLEIYIIELNKFEKYKHKLNNDLNLWINFIENPEVVDMKNTDNKEVKQAKKVLEEISQDEHERYLAELREKYIRDQYAIQAAGYDKGLQDGITQGSENEKIKIAKKMLKNNISIEDIISCTDLTKEEIESLV